MSLSLTAGVQHRCFRGKAGTGSWIASTSYYTLYCFIAHVRLGVAPVLCVCVIIVCVCVFIRLHITAQSGPVILLTVIDPPKGGSMSVCVCVCFFFKRAIERR